MNLSTIRERIEAKSAGYFDANVKQKEMAVDINDQGAFLVVNDAPYQLTSHSLGQLCSKVDFPLTAVETLVKHNCREALDIALNKAIQNTAHGNKCLIRLDNAAGTVRAVLSDQYAVVNNVDVVNRLIDKVGDIDVFRSTYHKDVLNVYIKANNRAVSLKDGTNVFPSALVTNSETGTHMLSVKAGIFRLVCTNGMVIPVGKARMMNRTPHRGRNDRKFWDMLESGIDAMTSFDADLMNEQFGRPVYTGRVPYTVVSLAESFGFGVKDAVEIRQTHRNFGSHQSAFGIIDAMTRYAQRTDEPEEWDILAGKIAAMPAEDFDWHVTRTPDEKTLKKFAAVLSA